jgi:hypothetical protein
MSGIEDVPLHPLNYPQFGPYRAAHTTPHTELVPTRELRQYATQPVDPEHAKEVAVHTHQHGIDPLILQYHPQSQSAYLGEGNHRLFFAEKMGVEHLPVRVTRNMYGLAGDGARTPQQHPAQSAGTHMPSDIRPSDIGIGVSRNKEFGSGHTPTP